MKAYGLVKDATSEKPLADARVELWIGNRRVANLPTDEKGRFGHEEAAQHTGETLVFKISKEGYHSTEVTHKVEENEIRVDVKLDPEERGKIELNIILRDEEDNPLEGVKVSLELDSRRIGAGSSDKKGLFHISLDPDHENKAITCKTELTGYEARTDQVRLKRGSSEEIILKRASPPPNIWPRYAVIGVIAILIIIAIKAIGGNEPPVIEFLDPLDQDTYRISNVVVKVKVEDKDEIEWVKINNERATYDPNNQRAAKAVQLRKGWNAIVVEASDGSDEHKTARESILVNYIPGILIPHNWFPAGTDKVKYEALKNVLEEKSRTDPRYRDYILKER